MRVRVVARLPRDWIRIQEGWGEGRGEGEGGPGEGQPVAAVCAINASIARPGARQRLRSTRLEPRATHAPAPRSAVSILSSALRPRGRPARGARNANASRKERDRRGLHGACHSDPAPPRRCSAPPPSLARRARSMRARMRSGPAPAGPGAAVAACSCASRAPSRPSTRARWRSRSLALAQDERVPCPRLLGGPRMRRPRAADARGLLLPLLLLGPEARGLMIDHISPRASR